MSDKNISTSEDQCLNDSLFYYSNTIFGIWRISLVLNTVISTQKPMNPAKNKSGKNINFYKYVIPKNNQNTKCLGWFENAGEFKKQ